APGDGLLRPLVLLPGDPLELKLPHLCPAAVALLEPVLSVGHQVAEVGLLGVEDDGAVPARDRREAGLEREDALPERLLPEYLGYRPPREPPVRECVESLAARGDPVHANHPCSTRSIVRPLSVSESRCIVLPDPDFAAWGVEVTRPSPCSLSKTLSSASRGNSEERKA